MQTKPIGQSELVDFLTRGLDRFRARALALFLKNFLVRKLYQSFTGRVSAGYFLTLTVYLPLAFTRPDILLISGPLIFGYPHLIASFRFTQLRKKYGEMNVGKIRIFTFFCILSGITILGYHLGLWFNLNRHFPFGVWQMVVAGLGLLAARVLNREFNLIEMSFCGLICFGFVRLAYWEPVIFVGGMLILHNWVGFVYWYLASKEKSRRNIALGGSFIFFIIHVLVLGGYCDSFIPRMVQEVSFPGESLGTGWYLASWSNEPIVWYRLLVLYSFGLSMHYFVWLRAIPQSLSSIEVPNSFRVVGQNLREEFGNKALLFTLIACIFGLGLWLFSMKLGSRVYFEVAMLHGCLELVFLFPRLLPFESRKAV